MSKTVPASDISMDFVARGDEALTRAPLIIRWAFEQFATLNPRAASRAAASLDFLLEGHYSSTWPEVAWSSSRLTGDFPCAFPCSSTDELIRYETEVAGPELAESERLRYAQRRLGMLGAGEPPADVRDLLDRIQASGRLAYGAWVSGRHGADTDRYKIYAEVPQSGSPLAQSWVRRLFGDWPFAVSRAPALKMIGYELGSARPEFYFGMRGMEISDIEMLLGRAGLRAETADLLGLMEEAYRLPLASTLRTAYTGFSLSLTPQDGSVVVSIFSFAHHIFGRDASVRRRLLEIGAQRGWGLRNYALLTGQPVPGNSSALRHGTTSFIAARGVAPLLYVGLCPTSSA